jgi:hypothetical protein
VAATRAASSTLAWKADCELRKHLLASIWGAVFIGAVFGCIPAISAERAAVVAVIRRYNEELPKATASWDTSGLQDYLIDRELAVRAAEINAERLTGPVHVRTAVVRGPIG